MIEIAKRTLGKVTKGQKGQALPIVLLLLVIGGLLIVPTLRYASTSLKWHQVTERKTSELYAADSGIGLGIWKVKNGELRVPGYELDSCDVEVAIGEVDVTEGQRQTFGLGESDRVYEIISTATTDSESSTTIIECYVVRTTALADEESYTSYPGDGNIEGGNVTVEAGGTVNGNIEDNATVYGEGNLNVNGNIEDNATVYVAGDLTVNGNIEANATVYVAGDLAVDGNIEANAKVLVEGNLNMTGNIEDQAIACVGGDLTLDGNVDVDVYVGGTISVGGNMNASNLGFENCPFCCGECPFLEEVLKILTFETN